MRVRIGTSHHGAFILENLNIVNIGLLLQVGRKLAPGLNHAFHSGRIQFRQGQIVTGRKANHETAALLRDRYQQRV
jgi:hypothetical protein